jgi:hypothetical protein
MSPYEIFKNHPYVQNHGGALEPRDDELTRFVERFRTIAHQSVKRCGDIKNVHIEFVFSSSFGAFAFQEAGINFIGINMGVPLILGWTFSAMLRNPLIFPTHVSTVPEEAPPPIPLSFDFNDILKLNQALHPPKDPLRKAISANLCRIASDALIFHELAHLRHGHLEFLRSRPKTDRLTHHTLEMDADCCSIASVFHDRIGLVHYFQKMLPNMQSSVFPDYEHALFMVLFGMTTMFRLSWVKKFDGWNIDDPTTTYSHHPPPPIRCTMLGATAYECIRAAEILKPFQAQLDETLLTIPSAVEHSISSVLGEEQHLDAWRGAADLKSKAYASSLRKRWKEIRDDLQQYSICKLAI